MKFYNIYILDIFLRIIYIFISFTLCWVVLFYHRDSLLLLEVLPILTVTNQKRFIATHLIHLFNTTWLLCNILSSIFIFPLIIQTTKLFFSASWYKYQLIFYRNFLLYFTIFFSAFYVVNQLLLIPNLVSFFLYWEVLSEFSLLRIEAEIALFFYVSWLLDFKFSFSFLTTIFSFLIIKLLYVLPTKTSYFMVVTYKKNFIFVILCIILFLIPSDFLLQTFLTFLITLFVELFLFFICIKIFFATRN